MLVKGCPEYLVEKLTGQERCRMNFICVVFVDGC